MLKYRYVVLNADPPGCHDCEKFHSCQYISQGHPTNWTCKEAKIKKKGEIESTSPEFEHQYLLRDITLSVCGTKTIQNRLFREDFYPEHMKPSWLVEPTTINYLECVNFVKILREYYKFIQENRINICSDRGRMTNILRTKFSLEDKTFKIISKDKFVKEFFKEMFKKTDIKYIEEFENKEKRS